MGEVLVEARTFLTRLFWKGVEAVEPRSLVKGFLSSHPLEGVSVCLLAVGKGGPAHGPRSRGRGDQGPYLHIENDLHAFFKALGDLFVIGPTGTNVMDVALFYLP